MNKKQFVAILIGIVLAFLELFYPVLTAHRFYGPLPGDHGIVYYRVEPGRVYGLWIITLLAVVVAFRKLANKSD